MARIALLALLTLSSCGTLDSAVDHAGDRTERVVTHTTGEVRKLKNELKQDISELKTETLTEVRETVEEMVPKAVDQVLNTEAVAFLIVTVTFLLGLVVVVALILLLGAVRTLYKRMRHSRDCSARQQSRQ